MRYQNARQGRYLLPNGRYVSVKRAVKSWADPQAGETLYQTRKGSYWLEHYDGLPMLMPWAEWLGEHQAARWIRARGMSLPPELAQLDHGGRP